MLEAYITYCVRYEGAIWPKLVVQYLGQVGSQYVAQSLLLLL